MQQHASRRRFLKYIAFGFGGSAVLVACGEAATTAPVPTATLPPAAPTAAKAVAPHFEYEGEDGPDRWGALSKDWATCAVGQRQSPINITGAVKQAALKDLTLDYKPTAINLVNNGHTVQMDYDQGSSFMLDGKKYVLAQFHFHVGSEHRVEGKQYAMELHLVHKYSDTDLAVIGVLMQEGADNSTLTKFWDKLPSKEAKAKGDGTLNIADALPADRGYYTYDGSLTTPACAEIVKWFVLKTPVSVSKAQVAKFQSVTSEVTARTAQPLNNRVIGEH